MRRPDTLTRFWSRVWRNGPDGCWVWLSPKPGGYGQMHVNKRAVYVHRFAYEHFIGPIPAGFQLDHICHTEAVKRDECSGPCPHRNCVNPAHLEPVTAAENTRRGRVVIAHRQWRAAATHCKNGHPWTDANTYVRKDNGCRQCRECKRMRDRKAA